MSEKKLKCIYGNKVTLKNLASNKTTNYTLVTFQKEKLNDNRISNYTKIGKAIWAKEEGDIVEIDVSGTGKERYQITKIENE